MHIDPTTPIEGFSPFTGILPLSKVEIPKNITKKIISFLEFQSIVNMMQTCTSFKKIITNSEPLHDSLRAFKLLKKSYLMGKNLQSDDVNFIRKKSEWLADVAVAIFPSHPHQGQKIAEDAIQLIETLRERKDIGSFTEASTAIAYKLMTYFPELAVTTAKEAVCSHSLINDFTICKKLTEKYAIILHVFSVCKSNDLYIEVQKYQKKLNEYLNSLEKAEALLILATGYRDCNPRIQKGLAEKAVRIIQTLTNTQKQQSKNTLSLWGSCIDTLFISDTEQARAMVEYFLKIVHEWKFDSIAERAQIYTECCALLVKHYMVEEAEGLINEIYSHITSSNNEDSVTLKERAWHHIIKMYSFFDPNKAIKELEIVERNVAKNAKVVNYINTLWKNVCKEQVFLQIAKRLPNLYDNEFDACVQKVNDFITLASNTEKKVRSNILEIKSLCLVAYEKRALQHMLVSNRKLTNTSISYSCWVESEVEKLPDEVKLRTLAQIALNRARFNLEKRAIAIQENAKNIVQVDLSFFDFNRVQAILDKMTDSFVKAQVMTEISMMMLK